MKRIGRQQAAWPGREPAAPGPRKTAAKPEGAASGPGEAAPGSAATRPSSLGTGSGTARSASAAGLNNVDVDVGDIHDLITKHCGLDRSSGSRRRVIDAVKHRMRDLGKADFDSYRQLALSNPEEVEVLAEYAQVHETYFFRQPKMWQALADTLLKDLWQLHPERKLRIWCAGCATGEEAYSLALIASESLPAGSFELLGTDISPTAIHHAQTGSYRPRSTRELSEATLQKFFERDPHNPVNLRVNAKLREPTTFAPNNLVKDSPPGRFDLVTCLHVLMYMDPDAVSLAVDNLTSVLEPGGILLLTPAEALLPPPPQLEAIPIPAAIAYRPRKVARKRAQKPDRRPQPPLKRRSRPTAKPPEATSETPARRRQARSRTKGKALIKKRAHRPARSTQKSARRAVTQESDRYPVTQEFDRKPITHDSQQQAMQGTHEPAVQGAHEKVEGRAPTGNHAPDAVHTLAEGFKAADRGDTDAAMVAAIEALEAEPLYAEAHFLMGLLAEEDENNRQAQAAFKRALYCDADLAPAHFHLGMVQESLGDRRDARRSFARALQELPRHAESWQHLTGTVQIDDLLTVCRAKLNNLKTPV